MVGPFASGEGRQDLAGEQLLGLGRGADDDEVGQAVGLDPVVQFFDHLLSKANVVGTPGSGFGASGEGYFRLSAFNSRANVEEAVARIKQLLK